MVKNKEIRKANEEYGILTGEAYERRLVYLIEKGEKDYNTQMIGARNEGIEIGIKKGKREGMQKGIQKGIQEGKQEERKEIIKNLLKLGVSIKIIEKAIKDEENEIEK